MVTIADKPPLNLVAVLIKSFEFSSNESFVRGQPSNGLFSLDFVTFRDEDDPLNFQLIMPISSGDIASLEETNEPYAVRIEAVGWFRFDEGTPEETISRMVLTNAPSILYGHARGCVAQVTSMAFNGQYNLPVFNFVAFAKKKFEEDASAGEASVSIGYESEVDHRLEE